MHSTEKRTKLLQIFSSTQRAGVEEYALTIASAAVKEGWDVYVAFPKREMTASLVQNFQEKGVMYRPLEIAETDTSTLKTIRTYLPSLMRTVRLLLITKPDVVHISLPWPENCLGSIVACGLLKIPTAVVFQLCPFLVPMNQNRLKIYDWARARNQQWIAVSENNRSIICKLFQMPSNEVIRIYNGAKVTPTVNQDSDDDIALLRRQVRQELQVAENTQIALTVARLNSQKGHEDLIPTIPDLTKDFPDLKFVLIGDGQLREQLLNKVREYGVEDKVFFLGYRSRTDVIRFLKSADIFVFPTRYEGQPFALCEAMAYGLPIITTDASGIPEIVQDKMHGLLCRKEDSRGLLEAISWALRHPTDMQEMAQKAQQRIQEFSEERMVTETLNVLHKLCQLSGNLIQINV